MKADLIFLEIAKKDLEAAKCLFSRKLYPHSIFYLQQSIEKGLKSFGIWSKTITEIEAKGAIGHKSWRVYSKIFSETKKKLEKLEKTLQQSPKLKNVSLMKELEITRLKNVLDKYNGIFSNATSNISFSTEELKGIVTEINKLENKLKRKGTIKINEEEIEDFKERFHQLLDAFSEIKPINVEETKNVLGKAITPQFISDLLKKMPIRELIFCSSSLFYLSSVFSPHATRSRYPQDNFNPLEIYNEKMPLIQMLDPFMKITEKTLETLGHVYTKMPEDIVKNGNLHRKRHS